MLKNYINDIINDNCYNEIKEDIEMLSELKLNITVINGFTVIKNIESDSAKFVINKAISDLIDLKRLVTYVKDGE